MSIDFLYLCFCQRLSIFERFPDSYNFGQFICKHIVDGFDSNFFLLIILNFDAPPALMFLSCRFLPYVGWVTIIMTEKPIIKVCR